MAAVAGAAAAAAWLYLLAARGGFWLEFVRRGPSPPLPERLPDVVAVVPARDEAAVVGRAAASLDGQRYQGAFRVVVVDDHSSDGTAVVARRAGTRVSVVAAGPLPPGWTGKLWAVSEGIRHADASAPEFFLLADADIVHPPGAVEAMVARACGGGYDLVSVMATLRCRSLAERALVPAFVFFFFMLYPPAWIRDPRRATAGAAGGCMLVRRAALERIGGIAAIRGAWIDDCALAGAIKCAGGRVWLAPGTATHSIREYAGFADAGRMIARSAFAQLRFSAVLLVGVLAGLLLVFGIPPLVALGGPAHAAWPAAAAWVAMSLAYLPALRFYRRSPFWAPALPLVAAFYAGATVHSALCHWRGRGALWKGRAQPVR